MFPFGLGGAMGGAGEDEGHAHLQGTTPPLVGSPWFSTELYWFSQVEDFFAAQGKQASFEGLTPNSTNDQG
jgi:hypothetical protein